MNAAMTVATPHSVLWRPSAALQVATSPHRDRRLAASLLAAIAAFTLVFAAAPTASSSNTGITETAVAAQTHADHSSVGADQPASPAAVGVEDVYSYDRVLGCCVAPTSALDDAVRLACSFSAETEVLMADGSTKPISEIEVGDWVLAEDPEAGERGARQVTHLWVHEDELVDLEIGGHDVSTTEDHRFWNATDQVWQRADALDAGDSLLAADGQLLGVGGIDWGTTRSATAYNLTVDDIHTYYVGVGAEEVLVHNVGCDDLGGLAADFDADELAQLTYQHVGAGDIAGRPSLTQISDALATDGVRLADQNAVRFTLDDVVVIINEDLPTRSTAFFGGG